MALPSIVLQSTAGEQVDLSAIPGTAVVYVYPMTGQPGIALPEGWDEIPGARGCTPQACDFSNHHAQLQELGATVFGLSSQTTDYQAELKQRLHLPFELLSDSGFKLKHALKLPVFTVDGRQLYKRLTIIAKAQVIQNVFYPVFPPDQHAKQIIDWLKSR
jgi:peroxiredoxin